MIGSGIAGLVTALKSALNGANTALVEKMSAPAGNSIFAKGAIGSVGSRIQKNANGTATEDTFFDDMMKVSAGRGDPALSRVYAAKIGAGVDWMTDVVGLDYDLRMNQPWPVLSRHLWVKTPEGYTGGSWTIRTLLEKAKAAGVHLRFNEKAVALIDDGKGGVAGVKVLTRDGYRELYAKGGVALATGGFSANPEMVDTYIGGWATRMVMRGSKVISLSLIHI